MSNGPKKKSFFGRGKRNNTCTTTSYPHSLYFHILPPLSLLPFEQIALFNLLSLPTTSPSLNSFLLHPFSLFIREDGLQWHTTYAAANTSRGVAWCARCCRVTSHVFSLFCVPTISVLLFALFGSVIYNPSLVSSFPLRCVLLRCTVDRPSLPDLAAACGQKPDRKKREVCPLLSCSNVLVRSMSILFFPFVGKQT